MAADRNDQTVDLLVTNGVLITVDQERRIILDGAIAIDGGRIVGVGSSRELAHTVSPSRTINARGGAVTPGFIDAHTHTSAHLGRGSIPDSHPHQREFEQHIPYFENLTSDDVFHSSMLACIEMVRNGTTFFSDLSGFADCRVNARAAEAVGLRGIVTERAWDNPPFASGATGDTDKCIDILAGVVEKLPHRGPNALVWGGVGFSGMSTASDRLIVEAKSLADSEGLIMYMHQSFADGDTSMFRERTSGRSACEHLDSLGVLDDRLQLIHMIRTEPVEVPLLASSGTHIVHCPAASLRVGMQVSYVGHYPEMVEAGVNVALGSDSGNYSDFYDVGRQMYLAATIHREARGEMPTISAEQVIEMATINGAKAVGVDSWLGSIEVGKQADIVIHSWDRPEWRPGVDPVNSLVYSAQSVGVDTVLVAGTPILDRGRFTRIDEGAELESIDAAARALNNRSGYRIPHRWPVVS